MEQGGRLLRGAGKSLKKWKGEPGVGLECHFSKAENRSGHSLDLHLFVR